MSLSGGSLINQAVQRLGRLAPGESLNTSEQSDLLLVVNNMVDNWSQDRLIIPVIVVSSAALTTATAAYTFGSGGTFGSTRFVGIQTVGILLPSAAISGQFKRFPVRALSQEEFQQIVDKAAASDVPTAFYYDYQFPVATGILWPTPTFTGTAPKLEIGGWQALAEFPDATSVISTPLGYDEALITNAAVLIAPLYDMEPPPSVVAAADRSLERVKSMNARNLGNPGAPTGPPVAAPPPPPASATSGAQ